MSTNTITTERNRQALREYEENFVTKELRLLNRILSFLLGIGVLLSLWVLVRNGPSHFFLFVRLFGLIAVRPHLWLTIAALLYANTLLILKLRFSLFLMDRFMFSCNPTEEESIRTRNKIVRDKLFLFIASLVQSFLFTVFSFSTVGWEVAFTWVWGAKKTIVLFLILSVMLRIIYSFVKSLLGPTYTE